VENISLQASRRQKGEKKTGGNQSGLKEQTAEK